MLLLLSLAMRDTTEPRRGLALALEVARESQGIKQPDASEVLTAIAQRLKLLDSRGQPVELSYSGWRAWTRPRRRFEVREVTLKNGTSTIVVGSESEVKAKHPDAVEVTFVGRTEEPWGIDLQTWMPAIAEFMGVTEEQVWSIARGRAVLNPANMLIEELAREFGNKSERVEGDLALLRREQIKSLLDKLLSRPAESEEAAEAFAELTTAYEDLSRRVELIEDSHSKRLNVVRARLDRMEGLVSQMETFAHGLQLASAAAPRKQQRPTG